MLTTLQSPDQARYHQFVRIATDSAVLVLFFGTMLSSWALGVVAGGMLIGLLVYAWFGLRHPERGRLVLRAAVAALAAGAIGAVAALLMH